ncbi:hypothetical protein SAMN04487968_110131 [Nocardioides terrae]|uniref:Peptidase_C39 like family protein n=1 Tax=Nocardioides terrae TaxID=574651 RepID=A0A1I1LMF7_9ACTN|nr:hypothetical protein [Nocardioides terrae]SFC74155.1 hypothetical protein SAMN04487968_110131 [Nocardioides terrae]
MTLPFGAALRQPDQTSCGAACVVVARLLRSPAPPDSPDSPDSFADDVLAEHRRLVRPVGHSGRAQLPWPAALGTPPWAVADALGSIEVVRYRTRLARWSRPSAFSAVSAAVAHHPVALYIGSTTLPRHVVLAIGSSDSGLSVYDPASGGLVTVPRDWFVDATLHVAGWDVPWFVVLPR